MCLLSFTALRCLVADAKIVNDGEIGARLGADSFQGRLYAEHRDVGRTSRPLPLLNNDGLAGPEAPGSG